MSRVAPELLQNFTCRTFSHIGQSIEEKIIGDVLTRCLYQIETIHHAISFMANTKSVVALSKAHASMNRDEKTRQHAGTVKAQKKYHVLIMELECKSTNSHKDRHDLGVFTKL